MLKKATVNMNEVSDGKLRLKVKPPYGDAAVHCGMGGYFY